MPEWKDTVNLPRTDFPMKANLPTAEPEALARWAAMDLYGQIRAAIRGATRFVLHEGPPYAERFIGVMSQEFQRLGVLGAWDDPYLTMTFKYQAAIARALGRFVEQDLVYKGKKPVHWCIHCRTALAEAEVEYEDHTSPSIYVEFQLTPDSAGELAARVPALKGRDVSVLIWTTTPWTIPSNMAVAFHPEFDYAAY